MEDGKLIGRSHELRFAREALESSRGLLITGVGGVGKTRFLTELTRVMTDAGASVLLTNSATAVSDLTELEARHPIVIVDDAHRLDLRLLELLCTNAAHGAITLCLAGLPISEVEPESAVGLAPLVRNWLSSAGAVRLRLSSLSGADTARLAAAFAAPHELSAFWTEKLRRVTGGLPALVKIYVTDAVRRDRLGELPDLLDPEARDLPPAEAIELVRPRVAGRHPALLAALTVLGQLSGVSLDRVREVVRRGDITALAEAELLEIRQDETVHVTPAVADVAASMLTADEERTALERAGAALMRFAPDGRRSPIEAVFLVRTWLRMDACELVAGYDGRQVRDVLHSTARLYTRAGRAQQALVLLERCPHTGGADDAMTLIEQARAMAALHDHDDALRKLQEAESLVHDEREARMLLNCFNALLVWHLGDPVAFAEVTARATGWLPDSIAWRREVALPGYYRQLVPHDGKPIESSLPTFLSALPTHRGTRASALAAGFLGRAIGGDGQDSDELLRMAVIEASEHIGNGARASALTALFSVRACLLMAALVRQDEPATIAPLLRDVVEAAVTVGGQSTQNLAFAKWFEALYAQYVGDPHGARRALESIDLGALPERLQIWIEIEYARALAFTGDQAEAHALVRRIAPTVRASNDLRAAFSLARARVGLKVAAGQPARAAMLARTIAMRLEAASPALAELVLREAQEPGVRPVEAATMTQRADASAEAPLVVGAPAEASVHSALITPIAPALHAAASKLLSAREILVARLAATGRSNAQIASELFLSVRTVESHLHHARVKLGVTGREGLAAFFRDVALPAQAGALEGAM